MRPNRGVHLLFAVVVGVAMYFVALPEARAVPSFSRKYQTSCQTCHTIYPVLNAFGEAFRRDGYRFPSHAASVDSDSEKAPAVQLGQEQYKSLFPSAVWPDKIAEAVPLSLWLNGAVAMNLPGSAAYDAAGNTFAWGGVLAEAHIFGAGAFSDTMTYMAQITLETDFGSPPGSFDIETGYLLWNDIVGPPHLLNLWVGRLFAPQLTSYGLHSSYLSDTVMPGVSVGGLYNPTAGFTLGHGHTDGVEANGIVAHRFGYSLGWIGSTAASGLSAPNSEDVYAHLGVKLGGMSLDGEGTGGDAPADAQKPWNETAITFDVFGYHGLSRLDNGTGIVAGGSAAAVRQDDRISALGGLIHAQLGSLVLMVGVNAEHHDRPYPGSAATANPSGGVFNGVPDFTSATAVVQYDELDYIVWPWFVPGVRAEYTHASVEGGSDAQLLRIIPGIAMLARPNIKVILSGDLEWATNLPTVGNWGPASGLVAPSTGQSKFEAEQITATVGVAF
jgi:hypothetical protein